MKGKRKYTCEYCDKELGTKFTLTQHQNTSKTCRSARGICDVEYKCEYCEKNFVRSYTLVRHLSMCSTKQVQESEEKHKALLQKHKDKEKSSKVKYRERERKLREEINREKEKNKKLQRENKKLEEELLEQQGIVKGMKTAPDKRTIYNTAIHPKLVNLPINNIRALTDEYVMERVNEGILTYEKAAKGYPGMLSIICDLITYENEDGVIERSYVCTDVSRNSFHRLLESRKWKSDKGGRYLNNMLNTFRDIMEEHKDKVYQKYKDTPHDSIEWETVEWERKKISQLYSGVVCNEGTGDREELVNILRKEISKRASV